MLNVGESQTAVQSTQARPQVPPGPYLVVGLGTAGTAAASALAGQFGAMSVRACDASSPRWNADEIDRLRREGVAIWTDSDGLDALAVEPPCRCIVKSPGVPFDAPVLQLATALGLPIIDELELGWRLLPAPMVGVTGTNGKSTVCALLVSAGRRAGLDPVLAGNTVFGSPLSMLRTERDRLIVCEVSSYQLEGCQQLLPDAAVLTNIGLDHLARHRTRDRYAAVKRRLFIHGRRTVPLAILNADDPLVKAWPARLRQSGSNVLHFGSSPEADFRLLDCGWSLTSGWLTARTPTGPLHLKTRLPGAHNATNVLAALALCYGIGIDLETAAAAIECTPGVAGRFELIDEGQPFDVIVDFAHSPDAIAAVLQALRSIVAKRHGSRLHAVISASGVHSDGIRWPMGATAGQLADHVIVTEGNWRGCPIEATTKPLFAGARSTGNRAVELVAQRRPAIRTAIAAALPGDVVAILGRGAMPHLLTGTTGDGESFDDRVEARDAILARQSKTRR